MHRAHGQTEDAVEQAQLASAQTFVTLASARKVLAKRERNTGLDTTEGAKRSTYARIEESRRLLELATKRS